MSTSLWIFIAWRLKSPLAPKCQWGLDVCCHFKHPALQIWNATFFGSISPFLPAPVKRALACNAAWSPCHGGFANPSALAPSEGLDFGHELFQWEISFSR